MRFKVVMKNFLHVSDVESLTLERAAEHFADNGYEPLYVCKKSEFVGALTLKNFRRFGLSKMNADFVRDLAQCKNRDAVENFFRDNPEAERLLVLRDGKIFCEVNLMTEPALINGVVKNLLALRFVKFYGDDSDCEIFAGKRILLLSDSRTKNYFAKLFPTAAVENIAETEKLTPATLQRYDPVFDFRFGGGLLKVLGLKKYVTDFYDIITRRALKILIEHSSAEKVRLKFYRIPRPQNLSCLSEEERRNFDGKISIARLARDENFLRKFSARERDYRFVKERKFTNSLRTDDGRCILQSDCSDADINVAGGVRKNFGGGAKKFSVHLFGPCTVFGMLVADDATIDAHIMRRCLAADLPLALYNHGGLHGDNFLNSILLALNTPVAEDDTFIFLDFFDGWADNLFPNMTETFEWFNRRKKSSEIMFADSPEHCNSAGNEIFAAGIFDDLEKFYRTLAADKTSAKHLIARKIEPTLEDFLCTHAATIKFNRQLARLKIFSR